MANDAYVSVIGFVATQPKGGHTKGGARTVSMRVGWTPRSFDRTTGEWGDQPSSFVTVLCYRKVAEHAAVCLRRGDPIVVRGTLRIREYADQSGARRSSVEVIADSLGHDLSRGITVFSKAPAQLEQTAYEYEQAMATQAGRDPLPGDRDAPESSPEQDGRQDEAADIAGASEIAVTEAPEAVAGEPEDGTEVVFGAGVAFDDDEARDMLAAEEEAAEPVGASA